MTISVRDANPADLEFVVDCNARLARETEGKELPVDLLRPGVAAALADAGKARYWIAEHTASESQESLAVGQLMVTLEWSDWRNGNFWWLQSVYVLEPYRRQGVFSSLYQHVAKLAAESPAVCGLRLYVEEENHRAQQVYRNLGMTPTRYHVYETELLRQPPPN
ncbi:MAG: GNAT family N-acetyltransferase [Planctomycetales bacterium]|nr:GNAT family N-acetyltransferase [Planctomycetales bacterium]